MANTRPGGVGGPLARRLQRQLPWQIHGKLTATLAMFTVPVLVLRFRRRLTSDTDFEFWLGLGF